ncbi:chloride channel protein, partial [Arthrospira platensis SPKY1]|nr:chloride channel protein [Arthrospira platensis SPKY1]
PRWIFLSAPVSFLVSWFLVMRLAPLAGGSGIPQLMAAIEVATDKKRDASWRFLNLRIILVKIASSLAMVVGGGAVGREGPPCRSRATSTAPCTRCCRPSGRA